MLSLRPLISVRHASSHAVASATRLANQIFAAIPPPQDNPTSDELELLKHAAATTVAKRPDGWVSVSRLLQHPFLSNSSFLDLHNVVALDRERRFELRYAPMTRFSQDFVTEAGSGIVPETWWLRVKKGNKQRVDTWLKRVPFAVNMPMALHVTSAANWENIKDKGLSRHISPQFDSQRFIHLSPKIPNSQVLHDHHPPNPWKDITKKELPALTEKVIIFLDVAGAMRSGIKFYLSRQRPGLILTPGNESGVIPPRYFRRVEKMSVGRVSVVDKKISQEPA